MAFSLSAFAQIPGYVGKRHQFTYTPSISLFANTLRKKQNFGTNFYLSHQVGYDYVVSKKKTIGLFYDVNSMDFLITNYGLDDENQLGRYTRHQLGFAYKKYMRNSPLAPLGGYWKFTMSMARITTKLTGDYATLEIGTPYKYTVFDVMPGFGVGREFIIARWIPLNIGFDVQLPFRSIVYAGGTSTLAEAATGLTVANSLLKFNIGIGILAF